ncbi:MAG: MarR family winged helix-turn-helix transcriptional regulator [Acidimicrobiales bacterium]
MGVQWLSEGEQALWRAFLRLSVVALDRIDAELMADHGLSLADYEILVKLSEAPGRRLRMSELARLALVSRSRLTYRVDRLVQAGLVARAACATDRRGAFAELTAAGLAQLEHAAPSHVATVRRVLLDHLDPAATGELTEQLSRAADALDAPRI